MSDLPEYILDRTFDAPREMVWKAWTDPELLPRWYGPNAETIVHEFDLKPNGLWLGEMKWGAISSFSKVVFQEVTSVEKLIWHHSTTDADWNITSNPMMPNWPRTLLTTVTFEEEGSKTNVRLSWIPLEATAVEIECFAGAMASLDQGWGSGYAQLDELLKELLAKAS